MPLWVPSSLFPMPTVLVSWLCPVSYHLCECQPFLPESLTIGLINIVLGRMELSWRQAGRKDSLSQPQTQHSTKTRYHPFLLSAS